METAHSPREAAVSMQKLERRFASGAGVGPIEAELHYGEVIGLLGPNGAGKSTLMRLMTGFLTPGAGSVRIAGLVPATCGVAPAAAGAWQSGAAARMYLGYAPEDAPLYAELTPREQLTFVAEARDMPRRAAAEAAQRALERAGAGSVADRLNGTLSKGNRSRVNIAQALVGDPRIVLLDEPTGGLDPAQRQLFYELIQELGKELCVLISTHVLGDATAICTRLLVLRDGRLVADGGVNEIVRAGQREQLLVKIRSGAKEAPLEHDLARALGVPVVADSAKARESGVDAAFRIDVASTVREHGQVDTAGGGAAAGRDDAGAAMSGSEVLQERVFDWAVEHGYRIVGMEQVAGDLGEVFRRLTVERAPGE